MKRIILVHGWDGTPNGGWFPWLKTELEKEGFHVVAPQLPEANEPRIKKWIPALAEVVGVPDEETYFVGHSMGCGAIIRYIESLSEGQKVGGAIFVAGFFRPLTGLTAEEEDVDREWSQTPIDTHAVKSRMKSNVAIFSDNDLWVPVENAEDFRERLGSEILIQHNQHHFNEGAGFKDLPVVLEKILEMTRSVS